MLCSKKTPIRLLLLVLSTVLAGCGTDSEIIYAGGYFAPNAAQGIYSATTLPTGYAPSAAGLPLEETLIASDNLAATVIDLGGGRQLRLFGRVNAYQESSDKASTVTGTLDVYLSEATPGASIPAGPHAQANITGGEVAFTFNASDPDILESKVLVLQLDFSEVSGQQSGATAAFFDDFDGDYALGSNTAEIELYDVSPESAFVVGNWTANGDPKTEVELTGLEIKANGSIAAEINGPIADYCAALVSPTVPAPFDATGRLYFTDLITGATPLKNAYLLEGNGVCQENNTVRISYTAIGWLSDGTDTQTIGTMDRLNFYVLYNISTTTPAESSSFGTRWQLSL